MTPPPCLLADTLATPVRSAAYGPADWARLIKQARVAELLGQLRARLAAADVLAAAPPAALRHLEIAWQLAQRHRAAVRWEVIHIREALADLAAPVVLLKGAAYCIANSPAALGRVFNDVDILVPHALLGAAEKRLIRAGWLPARVDAYDQRYYRSWMHELPPMEHKSRGTVLDVHHTIVPPTSGIVPDAAALIARAAPVADPELRAFSVLAPEDMVIHSACHLFLGEFHKGLRDLFDLHMLFEDFGARAGFWERLVERAAETGLGRPTLDAMQQAQRVFGTRISAAACLQLAAWEGGARLPALRAWLFEQVLRPVHPVCSGPGTGAARWFAYARSHWLRMPLPLLVYHLGHKALKGGAH